MTPPGSGQHAHIDPLGLGEEVCGAAGSLGNQAWTLPLATKGLFCESDVTGDTSRQVILLLVERQQQAG